MTRPGQVACTPGVGKKGGPWPQDPQERCSRRRLFITARNNHAAREGGLVVGAADYRELGRRGRPPGAGTRAQPVPSRAEPSGWRAPGQRETDDNEREGEAGGP